MLQFFKYVLATIIGLFVFMLLSFFLMIAIGSAFSSSDQTTKVKENSVLKLNFDARFDEISTPEDPFTELLNDGVSTIGLDKLKDALANAALDPNIKGVSISLNNPAMGFGTMQEVTKAIKDFKKSGKFVYTYSDYLSEKAVLLAGLADSSFINPVGASEFNGLSSEVTFLKGTMEKLGLEPVVFRVGEFKSAVEPFTRSNMSEENKIQVTEYIGSIANSIYTDYAKTKNITKADVDAILNKASMFTADETVANKLVSKTAYIDEYENSIRKKLGIKKDAKISYTSLSSYGKAKKHVETGDRDNRVAVIVSEGEIVQGDGSTGQIGSESFLKEIRKARKDKKIKAIVLRINSPGGSASASDIMWREIQLTRKEKPVIASMGDVAASGGYYMAMGCDTIVAHPTTITGSIGIFGMMFNSQKLMNEKLGVTFDGVKTHQFADSPSMVRKMSDAEKQTVQNFVNQGYETFTSKAAQGRKMSLEELKAVAGGRVWTGEQAKQHKLVDVLGNLDDAIKIAAKKAKLNDNSYQIKYYPYPKSELDRMMEKFTKKDQEAKVLAYLGDFAPIYTQLKSFKDMDMMQARMLYSVDFK